MKEGRVDRKGEREVGMEHMRTKESLSTTSPPDPPVGISAITAHSFV